MTDTNEQPQGEIAMADGTAAVETTQTATPEPLPIKTKPTKKRKTPQAAPQTKEVKEEAPTPGAELPDGTIYIGKRSDGRHVAAMPRILPKKAVHLYDSQVRSLMYYADFEAHGRQDWGLPDREVGKMLFALLYCNGLQIMLPQLDLACGERTIWLSETRGNAAWVQRLDDGRQHPKHIKDETFIHAVRYFWDFKRNQAPPPPTTPTLPL